MIPVEQYATVTDRIAALAEELSALDQAWLALRGEFERLALLVQQKHASASLADQDLARLATLDASLTALEQRAVEIMARFGLFLERVDHG